MLNKAGISVIMLVSLICLPLFAEQADDRSDIRREPQIAQVQSDQESAADITEARSAALRRVNPETGELEGIEIPLTSESRIRPETHKIDTEDLVSGKSITIVMPETIGFGEQFRAVIRQNPENGRMELVLIPIPHESCVRPSPRTVRTRNPQTGHIETHQIPVPTDSPAHPVATRTVRTRNPQTGEIITRQIPVRTGAEREPIVPQPFLYCSRCGMIPNREGTKCPATNASHNFVKAEPEPGKKIICSHCGATPSSRPTKCPVTNASHNFKEY